MMGGHWVDARAAIGAQSAQVGNTAAEARLSKRRQLCGLSCELLPTCHVVSSGHGWV